MQHADKCIRHIIAITVLEQTLLTCFYKALARKSSIRWAESCSSACPDPWLSPLTWQRGRERWEILNGLVLPLDSCPSTVDYIAPKWSWERHLEKYPGIRHYSSEKEGWTGDVTEEWFLGLSDGAKVVFNTLHTTCKAYVRQAFVLPYCTIIKYKGKGIGQ